MSAVFDQIIKSRSIVDYLDRLGHQPVRRISNGRLMYLCPLPGHNESKPSFVVWTNAEYENFYCFGCSRSRHIVHLVSFMEEISFKAAFLKLADGIHVTVADEILHSLDAFEKNYEANKQPFSPLSDLSYLLGSLSSLCRSYLKSVDFDPTETSIIDKLWESVDSDILEYRFDSIENTLNSLPSVLQKRKEKIHVNPAA